MCSARDFTLIRSDNVILVDSETLYDTSGCKSICRDTSQWIRL